ncbi:MAG: (2Fe-2S)-binding protein [Rhodospirillaceae bacterium]|nr:(2Fe-2S)-binding protein [Rhodospirillaceae bacterium]
MREGIEIALRVNNAGRSVTVPADETLLETLRERLALTGAKRGCNQGVCGACTVSVDGRPMRACLSLTANCAGAEIVTIEGVARDGMLGRIQMALEQTGAVQCGFCTSGMVIAAEALLRANPQPSAAEVQAGISGNLCRCSGYRTIVDAVLLAAAGGRG